MAKSEATATPDWWDETDDGSWDSLHSDFGEALRLKGSAKEPDVFVGKLVEVVTKELTDNNTGEQKVVPCYIFEGRDGTRYYIFENYPLKDARENGGLEVGSVVRLTHKGKKELDNGQSVNRLTIEVRR